jgi:hypothetical protein
VIMHEISLCSVCLGRIACKVHRERGMWYGVEFGSVLDPVYDVSSSTYLPVFPSCTLCHACVFVEHDLLPLSVSCNASRANEKFSFFFYCPVFDPYIFFTRAQGRLVVVLQSASVLFLLGIFTRLRLCKL